VWNNRSLIANRMYLTLLGLSCVIAMFGASLAFRSFYEFAQDRSVLEGELKIQKEIVAEFERSFSNADVSSQKKLADMTEAELDLEIAKLQAKIESNQQHDLANSPKVKDPRIDLFLRKQQLVIEKQNRSQQRKIKPKFDPKRPYEVIHPANGRPYPSEVIAAIQTGTCISTLLNGAPEAYDDNCPSDVISALYPKLNNGVYYSGRYKYSQLIFPALLFAPLILLVLGRIWFVWVFVQTNKSS
jgi:hypothetical protein